MLRVSVPAIPVLSAPVLEGMEAPRFKRTRVVAALQMEGCSSPGRNHFTEITDTPIFLFGVPDKCIFLLKAKNTEMREQECKLPPEQKLHKAQ